MQLNDTSSLSAVAYYFEIETGVYLAKMKGKPPVIP